MNATLFYIDGKPAREIVYKGVIAGTIKFPSQAWQNHCLWGAEQPPSAFDALPDESENERAAL